MIVTNVNQTRRCHTVMENELRGLITRRYTAIKRAYRPDRVIIE